MMHKKEENSKEREEHYRRIVETIPQKIFTKDTNSVYLSCNTLYASDLGINPEEIVGKTDYEFFPKSLADRYRADDRMVMISGKSHVIIEEYVTKRKNYWVNTQKTPILDESGSCIGVLGIFCDITRQREAEIALQESEERYRLVVENSHDAIVICNQDRFLFANRQAGGISGWSLDELLQIRPLTLVHPCDHERVRSLGQKALLGEPVPDTVTISFLTKNGDARYAEITLDRIIYAGHPVILSMVKDITEKKKAEEALLTSEKKYRLLYDNLRDGYASVDMTGMITECNDSFCQMLGYEPDEMLSLTYTDITPEDWHAVEADIIEKQVFADGFSGLYEKEYYRKDGSIVPVELRTSLVYDDWGNPAGMWAIIRDISGRKETENKLLRSEKRFRELFQVISSGVIVLQTSKEGTDFTIRNINPAGLAILVLVRDEIIGKSLFRIFPDLRDTEFHTVLTRVRKTRMPEPVALVYTHSSEPVRTENFIYPLSSDEIIVVFDDVTAEKAAQEALIAANTYNRGLFEANLDPLVIICPDGFIHDVNKAFTSITGCTRDELIGTDFSGYFAEPDLARAGYEKVFLNGVITDYELFILHKDGHCTPVLYNATIIRDESGAVTDILAVVRDITERRRYEELLIRFNDELEQGIQKKTVELAMTNRALEVENTQRILAESTIRKTLSLLNAAIESTADGILVVDRKGNVTTCNRKFADMWHIEAGIIDTADHHLIITYLADQLKDPDAYLKSVSDLNENPGRERYDMLELKDGRLFERYSIPQKIGETVIGRVWSYRDVTRHKHARDQIIASLHEKEVLLREIHHRVKNNLQLISSLLDMTRMRTADAGTGSILTDVMMKIKTMSQIHTRLYESAQFDRIDMKKQAEDQISAISMIYGRKDCQVLCSLESDEFYLPVDQAIPCALILNEILSNAYKHAFLERNHGTITIVLREKEGTVFITVSDDGNGISDDFDITAASSLGLKLVRNLIEQQLQGTLVMRRKEGTEVFISFPVKKEVWQDE
ncbi:MAG: PAS domain S-box protein [Methanospirillaceae archaeon]|nr:PAS domain S-box protein [Methanospirillaceae archaeon]